jgi:cytochrome bd-type quinol oxidase subunit 2
MHPMSDEEQRRKANLRMALILGSIAAVFFFGFIFKYVLLGKS